MYKKAFFLLKRNPSYFLPLLIGFFRKYFLTDLLGKSGYSFYPELITILVTKKCNFRCRGCTSNSPEYTKKQNFREMSLKEIKTIISEVAPFKPFIYLNGGEPTLRPDIEEIIKFTKSKKLVCAMTTNGSMMTTKLLADLIDSKLDFLSISIDGPATFHDQARGYKGAYDKAVKAVEEINELKRQRGIEYPYIRLASIIYPDKIENSKHIIDLANKLKVNEIGFGLLIYYPERIEKEQELFRKKFKTGGKDPIGYRLEKGEKFKFSEKEYSKFIDYLEKNAKMPVHFSYPGNEQKKYFDQSLYPDQKSKCQTPWYNLIIAPNGDMEICQGFIFGNVRKDKILERWNCEELRRFRKLRAKISFPACFRCLEGQKIKFDK